MGESIGARPQDRGFHETLTFLKGASLYLPLHHPDVVTVPVGDNHDDFLINNLGAYLSFNNETRFECVEYMTDYLAKEAAKVIESKAGAAYFLTVAFNAPHTPLQAKKSDFESLSHIVDPKRRAYAAMIKALDRGVGTILDAIQATERADNTLIIFTSDNGAPYYIGMPENNAPFRGGKYSFFEGGLRIPMMMAWPSIIPPGAKNSQAVAHVDIFSTVAAAAGIDIKELAQDKKYDGVNLLEYENTTFSSPTNHESTRSSLPHESLFWRSGHYMALKQGNMKIHVSERPDKVWIFNLLQDPTEHINLVPGLSWLSVNRTVTDSIGHCVEYVKQLMLPVVGANNTDDVVFSEREVCIMADSIIKENKDQRKALWPALLEVPIGIDLKSDNIGLEDDYVYWAN